MSRHLPTEKDALKTLTQAGCSEGVVEHCRSVADLASDLARTCKGKGIDVDVSLVRIGALLHDLGRARTHKVSHGLVGAAIARELRLPKSLIFIIERHVGSGISAAEARRLGFPSRSFVPQTIEERIVAYADKLIVNSQRLTIEAVVEQFNRDSNIPAAAVERLKEWHEEFSSCLEE